MPRLPLALAAAAAASLTPAAVAAAAPALQPLKPCYDAFAPGAGGTELVMVGGSGFTPNALVDVAVDGTPVVTGALADAAGALAPGTVPAPYVAKGRRAFTVTVTEQANPAQAVTVSSLVTALTVRVTPRSARPTQRVRFRGAGFTADGPVYAHYLRGKVRRTVRLVRRPSGPCGTLDVRRPQFPFQPQVGRWALQLDQQKRYRRSPGTPSVRLKVDVVRAAG